MRVWGHWLRGGKEREGFGVVELFIEKFKIVGIFAYKIDSCLVGLREAKAKTVGEI